MDEAMLDTWDIGTAPSELKGVIEAVDDILGVGILTAANGSGQYLVFFLEDIIAEAGWQDGLAIGDCVEYDAIPSTLEERDLAQRSRECQRLSDATPGPASDCKLELTMIANNLRKLAKNSVVLDEPLWGHPRYLGVVEVPLVGDDISDDFEQIYREDRVNNSLGGMIRLTKAFPSSAIPTATQTYKRVRDSTNQSNTSTTMMMNDDSMIGSDDSNDSDSLIPMVDEVDYLEESLCLTFDGSDLLSLRVLLEEGDLVEFDVYRNHRTGAICATNVVFVDAARRDQPTYRGIVTNIKHSGSAGTPRSRSSKASGPVIGGSIRILHEHSGSMDYRDRRGEGSSADPGRMEIVNFPISEWLDRDEPINIGDEVEFALRDRHVMPDSGRRGRGNNNYDDRPRLIRYAARILLCPKGYLTKFKYRPVLSDWIEGEVRVDTSHNHRRRPPSAKRGGNFERQCIVYKVETENDQGKKGMAECRVEIDKDSLRQQLLVAGDKVLFRILRSFVAPGPGAGRVFGQVMNERAMHVVVKKAAPRRNFGRIYSLHVGRERYRHGVDDCTQITHGFIQLNGRDPTVMPGMDDELIYFKFHDWIDPSIDVFYGMNVEFNLLRTPEGETCAVRVRPSEWPQTVSDREFAGPGSDGSKMRPRIGPDGLLSIPSRGSRPPIPPTLPDRFGEDRMIDSGTGLDHSTSDTSMDPFGGDLYSNGGGRSALPDTSVGAGSEDFFRGGEADDTFFDDRSGSHSMRIPLDTINPPPGLYASPPGITARPIRRSDDPDRYDHPSTFDDELTVTEMDHRRPPLVPPISNGSGGGDGFGGEPHPIEGSRPGEPLLPPSHRSGGGGGSVGARRDHTPQPVYFVDGEVTEASWTSGGTKAPGGGPPERRPILDGCVRFTTPDGETRMARFNIDHVVPWQMRIMFSERDRVLVQAAAHNHELITIELIVPRHTIRAHGVGVLAPDTRWVALKCAQIRDQGLVSMLFTQIMFAPIKRERKHFRNLIGTRFIFDLMETDIARKTGAFSGIRINPMRTIEHNVRGVIVKKPSEDYVLFPSIGRIRRYLPNGLICVLNGPRNMDDSLITEGTPDKPESETTDASSLKPLDKKPPSSSGFSSKLMHPSEVKALAKKGPLYGFSMTDFMGESELCKIGTRIVFDLEIPFRADQEPRGSIEPSIFNVRLIDTENKRILERSPPPINMDLGSPPSRVRRTPSMPTKGEAGSSMTTGKGGKGSKSRRSRSGPATKGSAVLPPRLMKDEEQRNQAKRGKGGSAKRGGKSGSAGAKGRGRSRGSGRPSPEGSAGPIGGKNKRKGGAGSAKSKKAPKPKPIKDIPLKISGGQKWSKKSGTAVTSSASPASDSASLLTK